VSPPPRLRPLLDEVLPRFDASELHDIWIPARPDVAFAAVEEVTVREVRLLPPLEALRGLPSLLTGHAAFRPHGSAPVLDEFTAGVVPLGERPGTEIAAGTLSVEAGRRDPTPRRERRYEQTAGLIVRSMRDPPLSLRG
jgi:hypothetical protein